MFISTRRSSDPKPWVVFVLEPTGEPVERYSAEEKEEGILYGWRPREQYWFPHKSKVNSIICAFRIINDRHGKEYPEWTHDTATEWSKRDYELFDPAEVAHAKRVLTLLAVISK